MADKLKYQLTVGGKVHEVSKENIDKYGWAGYKEAYPDATVRMRDDAGDDYDVPLDYAENVIANNGFHPFSILHKTVEADTDSGKVASATPVVTGRAGGLQSMSESMGAVPASASEVVDNFAANTDAMLDRVRDVADYNRSGAAVGSRPLPTGPKYNPRSSTFRQQYLTPFGLRTTNPNEAEAQSRDYRRAVGEIREKRDLGKQIDRKLDENEKALREAYGAKAGKMDKQGEWNDSEDTVDNFLRIFGATVNRGVTANAPKPASSLTDEESDIRLLTSERQLLEEARKLHEAQGLKRGDGFFDWQNVKNFGSGVADVLIDPDTYAGGIIGAQAIGQLLDVRNKAEAGEELSDNDFRLAEAMMLKQGVESSGSTPHGYTAGRTTAEMGRFMAQMIMNPTSGLGRAMGEKAFRMLGEKGAKAWAGRVLGTVAGDVASSAFLAGTLQAPTTMRDAGERHIGEVFVDADGSLGFVGGDDWGKAIMKASGAATIENYTEMLGSHLGAIGSAIRSGAASGIRRFGGGRLLDSVSNLTSRISATKWAQGISNFERRAQWAGPIGEMLEEEAGIVLNAATVGDNSMSDLIDPETQIDIALGVGLFGGFVSGVKSIGYPVERYGARRRMNRAEARAGEIFGDGWRDVRTRMDTAPDADLSAVVAGIVTDPDITDSHRSAVIDYARALTNLRGFNQANSSARSDGETPREKVEAEEAFDRGYDIAGAQERNEVRLRMERRREALVGSLGEDRVAEFDRDPLGALMQAPPEDGLRVQMADYANSRRVYEGLIQRVRDDIDSQVSRSDAMIERRTNRDTGFIHRATLDVRDANGENAGVYIVGGRIALNTDGTTMDPENSSESFIVEDAEGKLRFVAPSAVISVEREIDPVEEKRVAAERIRSEMARKAADEIDGVLSFTPGDVYTVPSADGSVADVTLVGETVDETGAPVGGMVDIQYPDGHVESIGKSDLQEMADSAARQRIDAEPADDPDTAHQPSQTKTAQALSQTEPAPTDNSDNFDSSDSSDNPPASSRIPVDETTGEPIYEQAEPADAWDAIVEQSDGDAEMAQSVISQTIEEKESELKKIGRRKPAAGLSVAQKIQAEKDKRKEMAAVQAVIDRWKAIAAVKDNAGIPTPEETPLTEEGAGAEPQTSPKAVPTEKSAETVAYPATRAIAETEVNTIPDISEGTDPTLSQDNQNHEEANIHIAKFREKYNSADIVVLNSADDIDRENISEDSKKGIAKDIGEGAADAWYSRDNGKIYIFAGRPLPPRARHHSLLHENIHAILDRDSGETRPLLKKFREAATQSDPVLAELFEDIRKQYGEEEIDEEFAAFVVPMTLMDRKWKRWADDLSRQHPDIAKFQNLITDRLNSRNHNDNQGRNIRENIIPDGRESRQPVSESDHGFPGGTEPEKLPDINPQTHNGQSARIDDRPDGGLRGQSLSDFAGEFADSAGKSAEPPATPDSAAVTAPAPGAPSQTETARALSQTEPAPSDSSDNSDNFDNSDNPPASRLEVRNDDRVEGPGYAPVLKRTVVIDGRYEATQVDGPDADGKYTGPYYEFDDRRFGSLDELTGHIDESKIGARIASAEADVNTEPTDAQKEAGNYRKGHVRIGRFDITIENPKGSVRSGTDASGKKWETEMKHTYGYIRGTEGVDKDHIDVFASSDIDAWDGRKAFVVDQYNPDGSFDEHKVMLGFNDKDEAFGAYLSNYEKGWENGRRLDVTPVNIEDFEKWIASSKRKTKPFAEYKSVRTEKNHTFAPQYEQNNETEPHEERQESQKSEIRKDIHEPFSGVREEDATDIQRTQSADAADRNEGGNTSAEIEPHAGSAVADRDSAGGNIGVDSRSSSNAFKTIEDREGYNLELRHSKDGDLFAIRLKKGAKPSEWKRGVEDYGTWSGDGRGEIIFDSYNGMSEYLKSRGEDISMLSDKINWTARDREINDRLFAETGLREGQLWTGADGTQVRVGARGFVKGPRGWNFATTVTYPDGRKESTLTPATRMADFFSSSGYTVEQQPETSVTPAAQSDARLHADAEEKIRTSIDQQRTNLADVDYLDSDTAAKDSGQLSSAKSNSQAIAAEATEQGQVAESASSLMNEAASGKAVASHKGDGKGLNRKVYDASVKMLRDAGIEVVEVSGEEAQAMLEQKNTPVAGLPNRANEKQPSGSVLLSAKGDSSSNPNVPSEAVAKIVNNTQSAKTNIKKFDNNDFEISTSTLSETFRGLGKLLKLETKGASRYTILQTDGGHTVAIRLSDHAANGNNFIRDNAERNLSIVIERRRFDARESDIEFTEATIPMATFEARPADVVKAIVSGVEDVLSDRPFTLDSSLGKVIEHHGDNPRFHIRTYHGTAAEFDRFDFRHMGSGEGAQAFGWGGYVTEVKGIGKSYATAIGGKGLLPKIEKISDNIRQVRQWLSKNGDYDKYARSAAKHLKELRREYRAAEKAGDEKDMEFYRGLIELQEQSLVPENHASLILNKRAQIAEYQKELDGLNEELARKRHLYTVRIPDDTGDNYLDWDGKIPESIRNRIVLQATLEGVPVDFYGDKVSVAEYFSRMGEDAVGFQLYRALTNALGSDRMASELLSRAGVTGIKYAANYNSGGRADGKKNYVLFNEADMKIANHVQFMNDRNGNVYGWTVGGKVYLNRDAMNPETPIHEYTHLWDDALRKVNPQLWAQGVELMKQTPLWNEIKDNPAYAAIRDNEDELASEVHSRLSGAEGARIIERLIAETGRSDAPLFEKAARISALDRLRQWIKDAWSWVKDTLAPWSEAEKQTMDLNEFVNMPVGDLLSRRNPGLHSASNGTHEKSSGHENVRFHASAATPPVTPTDRVAATEYYERMLSKGTHQFREAVQDSMLSLRTLYKAILGKDTRIEDVAGYKNAYINENAMSSATKSQQHEFFTGRMVPLLKAIGEICGSDGDARSRLMDYMMAKHGLERNTVLAERDAREAEEAAQAAGKKNFDFARAFAENRTRDYSGLTALTGQSDVAAAEAEARKMVDDYERDHDTAPLWAAVNDATAASLEKLYTSGLMSEKQFEQTRDMFSYYIPLRGWNETTSEEVYGYFTSREGPLMSTIQRAKGRTSKADDPIATIAMMADSAIREGNRNIMKQRFLNFVTEHPSDLVSVNDLWLKRDDTSGEWVPAFAPGLKPEMTPEQVDAEIRRYEAHMENLAKNEPDRYKRGADCTNIPYKVAKKSQMKQHQVLVKRGGRTYVLTINGNPRAAQALNGLTNPDASSHGIAYKALNFGATINRELSAMYTTRNPGFVASNFLRDYCYTSCMSWPKEGGAYALRYQRNFWGKCNAVRMGALLKKWDDGTLDTGKDGTEKLFWEFMHYGGETGYTDIKDLEAHKKNIASELRTQRSAVRKGWKALGLQLERLNRAVENEARFAAYITSRQLGRSIDRSIYDAKEISVNFNKKGAGGATHGLTGQTWLGNAGSATSWFGRNMFAFWNAAIQGSANLGRGLKRNPAGTLGGLAAMMLMGVVVPAIYAGIGDGDDEPGNSYWDLTPNVRRTNICIRTGGGRWGLLPLPVEFRALYGLGELLFSVYSGKERYSDFELGLEIAGQLSQVLPIDFLEGSGGLGAFVPTLAKPAWEAYINESWTGLPIYRDNDFNRLDPLSKKAYRNTDRHLIALSEKINEAGGGDEFYSSETDWFNPAIAEHMLVGYFGGVYKTIAQMKHIGETLMGEKDFDWRDIPIASAVVRSGDERTQFRKIQEDYFRYKDEYERTAKRLKGYDSGSRGGILEMAEKVDFLYHSPEYLRYEIFDMFRKDIEMYNRVIKDESLNEQTRRIYEKDLRAIEGALVAALDNPVEYLAKNGVDVASLRKTRDERLKKNHERNERLRLRRLSEIAEKALPKANDPK